MTRDELVTEIRNKLGYNTGLNASLITGALNNAQALLERKAELPWFLETEISSITTITDEERIPVPTDFLREVNENVMWYYDSTADVPWVQMFKTDIPSARIWWKQSSELTGKPQHYALQNKYFRIFPTPDAGYTIKLIYYKRDALLAGSSDANEWSVEAPYLLIGRAGMLLADNNRDAASKQIFGDIFNESLNDLSIASEAREHAGQIYQRGGPD